MIMPGTEIQVLVATKPVDFRKQADGLAAIVQQALAADPAHYRTHRNIAVLLDLYLWRPAEALQHFESYLSMSGTADRQVSGWIAELKRRVGDVAQTAGVQP
mgnify:CR=1 FL=1